MSYISASDITDGLILGHQDHFGVYLRETDRKMEDLARRKGVFTVSDIDTNDDGTIADSTIRDYLISYMCYYICRDNVGVNKIPIDEGEDVYVYKMKMYLDLWQTAENNITKEMITGDADEITDLIGVTTTYIPRG